jgi:DNA-binding IclR family transcriptional regulator
VADDIRLDEVLAELSRLESNLEGGPAGFTGRELAQRLGMTVNTAQARLRDLVYAGKIELAGKRPEVNIAGGRCRVPVYRIVKGES